MRAQLDKLGKASITIEKDYWDINKDYNKLTIVKVSDDPVCYISRIPVPAGIELTNKLYWVSIGGVPQEIIDTIETLVSDIDDLKEQVRVLTEWKHQMDEVNEDGVINTFKEAENLVKDIPEGTILGFAETSDINNLFD